MAYRLILYGLCKDPVAHHVVAELVAAVTAADGAARYRPAGPGIGWTHGTLTADRPDAVAQRPTRPVHPEVDTRPDLLRSVAATYRDHPIGSRLVGLNVSAAITLSGEPVDWHLVRALWSAVQESWLTIIPRDEVEGFDVPLDGLT